jgi:hypothetical protein
VILALGDHRVVDAPTSFVRDDRERPLVHA